MLKPSSNQVWPQRFPVDSEVMVCDYRHADKLVPGTIVWKLGPVTYQVDLEKGNIVKCYVDQLTRHLAPQSVDLESKETPSTENYIHYSEHPALPSQELVDNNPPTQCYLQRVRRPSDRFLPFQD